MRPDKEERNDVISELEQKLRHNVDKDTKGQQNFENEIRLCQTLSRVVHPEHVDGAGQVLDGPVPHHDPPPDVEGVMSIVCQEVGVGQGVVVNDDYCHSHHDHHLCHVLSDKHKKVWNIFQSKWQGEECEESCKVSELGEVEAHIPSESL